MNSLPVPILLVAALLWFAPSAIAGGVLEVCANRPAKVFLDGEEVGVTPIKLVAVAEGHHVVKVKAEGGDVATEEVDIPHEGTVEKTVAFNFAPREERLKVTAVRTMGSKDLLVGSAGETATGPEVLRGPATPPQEFPTLPPPQAPADEVAETSTVVDGAPPPPPLDTAAVGAPVPDVPPPPQADPGPANYGDAGPPDPEPPVVAPTTIVYQVGGISRWPVRAAPCAPPRCSQGPIRSGFRIGRGFGGNMRGRSGNFNQIGRGFANRGSWSAQRPAFQSRTFAAPSFSQPAFRATPVFRATPAFRSAPVFRATPAFRSAPAFQRSSALPMRFAAPVANFQPPMRSGGGSWRHR